MLSKETIFLIAIGVAVLFLLFCALISALQALKAWLFDDPQNKVENYIGKFLRVIDARWLKSDEVYILHTPAFVYCFGYTFYIFLFILLILVSIREWQFFVPLYTLIGVMFLTRLLIRTRKMVKSHIENEKIHK